MTTMIANPGIAILVANGFDETHITAVQRAMTKDKKTYKIVAPEQGLVNGWQDNAWGHYFTVDESLSSAMGSDYDLLILIGGERGVAKLKANPHTRRIVNHFLEAEKPIAAIGFSVGLLALSTKSAGLTVSGADAVHDDLDAGKMIVSIDAVSQDGVVLTADGSDVEAWVAALMIQANSCVAEDTEAEAA